MRSALFVPVLLSVVFGCTARTDEPDTTPDDQRAQAHNTVARSGWWQGEYLSFKVRDNQVWYFDYDHAAEDNAICGVISIGDGSDATISDNSFVISQLGVRGVFSSEDAGTVTFTSIDTSACKMENEVPYPIAFVPDPCAPGTLEIDLSKTSLKGGQSIEVEVFVSPILKRGCGGTVPDGVEVQFALSDPERTGTALDGDSAPTVSGIATVQLVGGDSPGHVELTAGTADLEEDVSETIWIDDEPSRENGDIGDVCSTDALDFIFVLDGHCKARGGDCPGGTVDDDPGTCREDLVCCFDDELCEGMDLFFACQEEPCDMGGIPVGCPNNQYCCMNPPSP